MAKLFVKKRISLNVPGDIQGQSQAFQMAMRQEGLRRVIACANLVKNEAALGMADGPQTGRTYTIPGTSKTYTASAPGEFPAVATGRLRSSLKVVPEQTAAGRVSATVGATVYYGSFLEYGTQFMAARPFLLMAKARAQNRINHILQGKWFTDIADPGAQDTP